MNKVIMLFFFAALIVLSIGCFEEAGNANGDSNQNTASQLEELEQQSRENQDAINELQESNTELQSEVGALSEKNEQLTSELSDQKRMFELFPQVWVMAEKFLDAYVDLDYDEMSRLISEEYSIEEDGIIDEDDIRVPYLADLHDGLTYNINNFGFESEDEIFLNIVFYIDGDSESWPSDIVFKNLRLELSGNLWRVTMIE